MMTRDSIQFTDMNSMEEILSFLKNKGENHKYYYHYTDLDSFIKIIDSGYFHLTRGNAATINDQHECLMKGSHEVWNRTYFASFAFGGNENMAMWGLYGLPWKDAVRISIPKKEMRQWIENTKKTYSVSFINNRCIRNEMDEVPTVCLSDIVYIDGKYGFNKSKLYWNAKSLPICEHQGLYGIDSQSVMTGFIKNDAWKYENEVRIHVLFNQCINYDKIAIEIPNEVINAMTITTGPYFQGNLLERLEEKIRSVIRGRQIQNSEFANLVNYRTVCNFCTHGEFIRK